MSPSPYAYTPEHQNVINKNNVLFICSPYGLDDEMIPM